MSATLEVKSRAAVGSKASRGARKNGIVPGVVYGAGAATESIEVSATAFQKVWKEAGESTIIALKGLGNERTVLIQDVALDVLYGAPIHVDFLAVRADEKVTVNVPLVFAGFAPAEKDLGGSLVKVLHEIVVEALPKDLPHDITVDLSTLMTFDDQIKLTDLTLPAGVTAEGNPEDVVALVQPPRASEEEQPTAPVDLSAIEVEKKGKVEEPDSEV